VDGDHRFDLLTGSDNCCDSEPGVYWFRREANGRFSAQPKLRLAGGTGTFFMPQFRATLADWDGDGSPEFVTALTGTSPGLFRGDRPWVLAPEISAPAPVEGSPSALLHQPCIVDWDQDGRLDLVARTYSTKVMGEREIQEIVWLRNRTQTGAPRLGKPQHLLAISGSDQSVGVTVDDWDGDGWPDLILGYVHSENDGPNSYKYAAAGVRVYCRRHR
jgi:FG-GAP-like repeat